MITFELEAACHMVVKNKKGEFMGYRVKLSVLNPEPSLYINGMVVRPPDEKSPFWRALTPKIGNTVIVEFNGKKSKLWPEIYAVCLRAVWDFKMEHKADGIDPSNEYDDQLLKQLQTLGY